MSNITKSATKRLAEIMLAYAEGKDIEWREVGSNVWHDLDEVPTWNWKKYQYRVKPTDDYNRIYNELIEHIDKEVKNTTKKLSNEVEELKKKVEELESKQLFIPSQPLQPYNPPYIPEQPYTPWQYPIVTYTSCNGKCSECQRKDCVAKGGHTICVVTTPFTGTFVSTNTAEFNKHTFASAGDRDDLQINC